MNNFNFYNPAKILFGRGRENEVAALIAPYTNKVLLVYSGDYIHSLGIYKTLQETLVQQNIQLIEFSGVVPNPKVDAVREAIELCRQHEVGFVLAIGGGSVIDTAKAVAMGVKSQCDVWDFYTGNANPDQVLPIGVIATLPASGSEMSNCSIISNGEYKCGVEDHKIIPQFAVLNPEFTLSLPPFQTACGIADILSHLLERYFSSVSHTDLTDRLLEGAVKSLLIQGINVMKQPDNYDYRAEVMWTATMAHNNILETGREPDWGSHRIEHEISAQYDIAHGLGMAIIFPAWMRYVSQYKPQRFIQYANRVFGVDMFANDEQTIINEGIVATERFFKKLGLSTRLSEVNIDTHYFDQMAKRATNDDNKCIGHYMPLSKKDIINILQLAL